MTKEKILRVVILFIGLVIAHLGVTLFLLADLGADPFNVFIQGLFRLFGVYVPVLTHGITHMVICFLIIVILLFVDKSYIKIGTVICMFFGGPIIDVFTMLLTPMDISNYMFGFKVVVLALGCAILAFGMTIVIKSEAGTGPNDLVAVVISEKRKWRFGIVRIAVDFSFIIVGAILGGKFGIGTIICAFLVGPVADFFLPKSEMIVKKMLKS